MLRRAILFMVLVCALASTVSAQSTTGRHRRKPPVEPVPVQGYDDAEFGFFIMVGGGLMSGGDLVRVRTADVARRWDPPGGPEFQSDNFLLTLDESIAVSVALGARLSDRFWLRGDFGFGQLDMTAEARVGESAEIFQWDQMSLTMAALELECRLVRNPSYPYLLGGLTAIGVRGEGSDDYDETVVAPRVGAGYHLRVDRGWGLRVEIRDALGSLDFSDFRPPVVGDVVYPNIDLEEKDPQHFVEVLLSMQLAF